MNSAVLNAAPTVRNRSFHLDMACVVAFLAITGFGSSFFLKGVSAFPLMVHVHGAIFMGWIALYVTQTALVRVDRRDLHRRLGVFGAVLALAVVWSGFKVTLMRIDSGVLVGPVPPTVLSASLFTNLILFSSFVGLAVALRNDRETHKRLMLLATISIIAPAIARYHLELFGFKGPPLSLTLSTFLIIPGIVHDLRTRSRVHPAYVWGGLVLVVSVPLRYIVGRTEEWQVFVKWLAS